jgi:DNA invertase Pin-like site-specific DNA recombinase
MRGERNISFTPTPAIVLDMGKRSLRVLGRVRLSVSSDDSTSVERQCELITAWADTAGHQLVGWAEDVDVSGSTDPFETPALGPWLGHRAGEWDVLVTWKLDRLSRNSIQLNRLFGWCLDHGKTVVSCSESIDLGTPVGRLIANVIGFLAEGELEAIRERVKASKAKLRESARWGGGKPPYGYRPVPRTGGGYSLETDPVAAAVVRRIVDDVLSGVPLTRVAANLTAEGVDTPQGYYARQNGSEPRQGASWQATPLRNMLRSPALRGRAHFKGETVRGDDGQPVQLADPLVTDDEWSLLQAHLDRVQESRKGAARPEASPLAGVVFCGVEGCNEPLHHDKNTARGTVYRYYRCRLGAHTRVPAETLETLAGEAFLYELGTTEVRERVWVPGDSHETELRECVAAMDELVAAAGRMTSATAKQRLQRQLDALDARIAELEQAPKREARWEYRGTGQTYGAVWEAADADARRELLSRSGITVAAAISGIEGKRSASQPGAFTCELRIPEGIRERVTR